MLKTILLLHTTSLLVRTHILMAIFVADRPILVSTMTRWASRMDPNIVSEQLALHMQIYDPNNGGLVSDATLSPSSTTFFRASVQSLGISIDE